MARFKWKGSDEYIKQLQKLYDKSPGMVKAAVYEGAKIVADEIKAGLHEHDRSGALSNSMALSTMKNDGGYIYTKVQFVGYDESKKSKAFPRGVPNAVKAAVLESGGSNGQKKYAVIRKAVNRSKKAAIEAMNKKIDEGIKKIISK